jgi:glycyl-tRNA synthetase
MGWSELEGIANRTDFDLKRHTEYSGDKLDYFDHETNEHYIPYVIEPSAGADRATLAFLVDAYYEEPDKDDLRVVLRFHPTIAPIKVAVLPLSRKEQLTGLAKEICKDLRKHWVIDYDDAKSIGRRYRRQDEVGTPYCITVDFQSQEDQAVTVRDRDTMEQTRVSLIELVSFLHEKLD